MLKQKMLKYMHIFQKIEYTYDIYMGPRHTIKVAGYDFDFIIYS